MARWFLHRFDHYDSEYGSVGDLEEDYFRLLEVSGPRQASWFYWSQVLQTAPRYFEFIIAWRLTMLGNYIKIALRNIQKRKVYSILNITGLSIGMACSMLLFLWIQDEIGFDRFHEHTDRLCRVLTEGNYTENVIHFSGTPAPLGPAMEEEFPEIERTCRFVTVGRFMVEYGEKRFYETEIAFADPSFFKMFSFPMAKGDATSALSAVSSVVISEEMADKYFGLEDPIGKTLRLANAADFLVTAVVNDLPENSSIEFDFLMPIESYINFGGPTHWGGHSYGTFVLLEDGAAYEDINIKMPEWTEAHTNEPVRYYLQAMKDAYLYGTDGRGAITYVMIFSAISVFVLIVACINFMNLSTAKSGVRALEVGMRKALGADRSILIRQFFGESTFLTLIAFVLALVIVFLALPWFNHISGKHLSIEHIGTVSVLSVLVGIAVITGLISGSYPAMFLSSFSPAVVLRGTLNRGKGAAVRRALVVFQFTLSIILIIGSVVLYRQLIYIRNRNLGFDREQMLCIQMRGDLNRRFGSLKAELGRHPGIPAVTAASGMPGGPFGSEWGQINWEGKDPDVVIPMQYLYIEDEFIETLGMEIVDGRNISRTFSTDTLNVILNEAAVQATGLEDPLGKQFYLLFRTGTVVGIVKDFHITSLRSEIGPVILRMTHPRFWNYAFLRVDPAVSSMEEILGFVEETWKEYSPEYPFEYQFLDDRLDRLYRTEQRVGRVVMYFTCLTIFIACLGLFGLASFMAERKTKEIGVRKVLGASVTGIVVMLSREFTRWVILANVIAWPVAYLIMRMWLRNFAYRMRMDVFLFLLSGIAALVIAWLTVSYQAMKAAQSNTVDALRYE